MYIETSLIILLALLAFLVSWTSNVFMSLMYSVGLFINATAVLLILGFEFLALVNMLVYVGALAVLFLFVIMLLEIPSAQLQSYQRGYGFLASFGLFGILLPTFAQNDEIEGMFGNLTKTSISNIFINMNTKYTYNKYLIEFTPTVESISAIGNAFYVRYADLLILNSLILTIALFGALVLVSLNNKGFNGTYKL